MKNIVKKLIIKSYTKDYYTSKLDEIQTIRIKASVQNDFTSIVRFVLSFSWLYFYTSIIDFFINTFIILGIIFFKFLVLIVTYLIYIILINI